MKNAIESTPRRLLDSAKWAFSTRRVTQGDAVALRREVADARAGDLVLARVRDIGSHRRVQLSNGRPAELYPGDLIVAVCAARYAADQFEGIAEIDPQGADLLAGGGCIGRVRQRHASMKAPTRLTPVGLLSDADGAVLNLTRYALVQRQRPQDMPAIAVVGASMNAGKTTAVAALVHGLRRAGYRVAAIKATGTGAFGDYNAYQDAGAHYVADFTDAGMASTYLQPVERIERALDTLLATAHSAGAELAVVEFADGLLQRETAALLRNPQVRSAFSGFVYAVADSLAALGGCVALRKTGIVPDALTGLICRSPLNVHEASLATGLPVLSREQLTDPAAATALLRSSRAPRLASCAA